VRNYAHREVSRNLPSFETPIRLESVAQKGRVSLKEVNGKPVQGNCRRRWRLPLEVVAVLVRGHTER
jgi:hypothetical protein